MSPTFWEAMLFLTIVFNFMLDPDPNPEPDQECIPVPISLRQKVAVPAVPVPQHGFWESPEYLNLDPGPRYLLAHSYPLVKYFKTGTTAKHI
jgi:hypothetical protein